MNFLTPTLATLYNASGEARTQYTVLFIRCTLVEDLAVWKSTEAGVMWCTDLPNQHANNGTLPPAAALNAAAGAD